MAESKDCKQEEAKGRRPTGTQLEGASIEEALSKLGTDPEKGLSEDEVAARQIEYGENTIEEEEAPGWKRALKHFWGPIPWMIEAAAALSVIAARWDDLAIILLMLLVNGGVGFWHESRSQSAIKALKERLALEAAVLRGGERKTVAAESLVPGDIVEIHMGQVVPADAKLLSGQYVSTDESSLTGESLPVDKEPGSDVYSGTGVKRGSGRAVVTATGKGTKFSRTAELVAQARRTSHFQEAVIRIGTFLIGTTGVLVAAVVFVTWLLRGDPWDQVLVFALGLTLAGIPSALPAVLSVTLSVGASMLAKKEAIVSELAAMEEIAGLEVLCVDKTGTLTLNELQMQRPVVLAAKDEHDLLVAAALTCEKDTEDPIDRAVLGGLTDDDRREVADQKIVSFHPFDPTRKRAEARVAADGGSFTVAKGAPQIILELVKADEALARRVSALIDDLGKRGFRAIGVARRREGAEWQYLGLLPLLDPPREDAREVVEHAEAHGIDLRMVTGDHPAIGRQVAQQVGLGTNLLAARDLLAGKFARGREAVAEADGFAEVTPEDKFQIIKMFQARDRIVGMTGDGVNDAPALEQADVGIAVSCATEAARAAASLVLTRPGLGVIIDAVEEARRIFTRMTVYATYRIAETMRVLLFVTIAILAYDFFPVTPIMIVLLAILNDIPIMAIASDNAETPPRPVRWDMPRVLAIATVLSVAGVMTSFLVLWYVRDRMGATRGELQTAMFLKLLVAGHLTLFLARNKGWPWQRPWPSLPLLLTLEATQILGTLAAIFGFLVTPIRWQLALGIWLFCIGAMLVVNVPKVLVYDLLRAWNARREARRAREEKSAPLPAAAEEERFEAIEASLRETRALLERLVSPGSRSPARRAGKHPPAGGT